MITMYKDNRSPSLSDTIRINDLPFDLSASQVRFKMRLEDSSTLKVDSAAAIVTPSAGLVRYDWAAADVDTAGNYVGWWEVTTGGKKQDTREFAIVVLVHAPLSRAYVEVEELKSTLVLEGQHYADEDIQNALTAASRAIDEATGQRFYPDADAAQIRYYTANGSEVLGIDPLITLTSIATDPSDDGTFEEAWVAADYILEPVNAPANGEPYSRIRRRLAATYPWPGYEGAVKVTGKFGWSAPPAGVKVATSIIATQLLRRVREAPFGIVGIGVEGAAVRISQFDPQVKQLLAPYTRRMLFA
jgi:hypothetical protein